MRTTESDDPYELNALRATTRGYISDIIVQIILLNIAAVLGWLVFEDVTFLVLVAIFNVGEIWFHFALFTKLAMSDRLRAYLTYGSGTVLVTTVMVALSYSWFTNGALGQFLGIFLIFGAMLSLLSLRIHLAVTRRIEIIAICSCIVVLIIGTLWVEPVSTRTVAVSFGLLCLLGYFLKAVSTVLQQQKELEALRRMELQRERMEGINQLTAGIAHDFNNLLAVVLGNFELRRDILGSGGSWNEAEHLLEEAENAGRRAAERTHQLLSYNRRAALKTSETDLEVLVRDIVRMMQSTLPANIELKIRSSGYRPVVNVDSTQLENVVINLLVNAKDALKEGGRITVAIDVPGSESGKEDLISLMVEDDGPGIDPAHLPRVTEPYFTTKPPGKGVGLGLSSALGFAEQSGGSLSVRSELGNGTTVQLSLPAVTMPGIHTSNR